MNTLTMTAFRVVGFRSVDDSDWIETDGITSLIGTNEAGKTNLLLPLWKFNPARDGAIQPTSDYPRKSYNDIRNANPKPVFVMVRFDVSDVLAGELSELTGSPASELKKAEVHCRFDSEYLVYFPEAKPLRAHPGALVTATLDVASKELSALTPVESEAGLRQQLLTAIGAASPLVTDSLDRAGFAALIKPLAAIDLAVADEDSAIAARFKQLVSSLTGLSHELGKKHPQDVPAACLLVESRLPKFVYYSNYGNLDSEIYLPHVVENLERDDLGSKDEAKARTLRVLFEFVELSAEEILKLGVEVAKPTPAQIEETQEQTKKRDILLQSASASLTRKFREWWKQGEYRFRFQADGNHFRIWVSDDLRPEDIELEGRSAGLQWFLSFYLVFLVESQGEHDGAVLLLDEPGHSLHPLAQEDLSAFFESLSGSNQLIFTTHSPFLVDPDHLDRVKAVFVGEGGTTEVSPDLRAPAKSSARARSIYPVHAALGLSVSRTMLAGCQPVMVEGQSDQLFLVAIRNYLIANRLIAPPRELLFIPVGGTKGAKAVLPVFAGSEDIPPFVLLDDDTPGRRLAGELKKELYHTHQGRVLNVAAYTSLEQSETEDLWPREFIADVVTKYLRGPEEEFADVVEGNKPLIGQIEEYAKRHSITLESPGWKVDVAERVKARLALRGTKSVPVDSDCAKQWVRLFEDFLGRK